MKVRNMNEFIFVYGEGKMEEWREREKEKRREQWVKVGREPCKKSSKDVIRMIILKHVRDTNASQIDVILY